MESQWYLFIIAIFFLLILSAFFSSAETAITSINIFRLKALTKLPNNKKKKFKKKAVIVFKLVKNYNSTLTSVLIGNTIVNLALGSIFTAFFISVLNFSELTGGFWATIIATIFVLLIGEIIPKNLAKSHPEKFLLFYAATLNFLNLVFYPILVFFKLFHNKKNKLPTSSELELIELVSYIEKEGVLEKAEKDLIESAIKFDEKAVLYSMQPVTKTKFIFNNATQAEIKQIFLEGIYTRIPVVNIETNVVIGILNLKDFMIGILKTDTIQLEDIISTPLFISKRTKLNKALEMIQSEKTHLAIVCSSKEKKDFTGIITLEDILEELVGEIYDESDKIGLIQEVGTHKFLVDGKTDLNLLFSKYLKTKTPKTKLQEPTLEDWIKYITKKEQLKKSLTEVKYRHYVFWIEHKNKNKTIFGIEVLTDNKKSQW